MADRRLFCLTHSEVCVVQLPNPEYTLKDNPTLFQSGVFCIKVDVVAL